MKRKLYEIAGYKAFRAHCMTEALKAFADLENPNASDKRECYARSGMSYILEYISDEMRAVYQILDVSKEEKLFEEVIDPDRYVEGFKLNGFEDIQGLIKESRREN